MTRPEPSGLPKCLLSGGSFIARMKLKGIDARESTGVKTED